MSGPNALISPDGQWWWDGRRWVTLQRTAVAPPDAEPDLESEAPVSRTVIPIQRSVPRRYSPDIQPPELTARFGSVLLVIGFALTLPAAGVGTVFSMAVATGQSPAWPTIGEGILIYAIVLGFLGSWPLLGFLLTFGIRDGLRWVLLCLACSGFVPGLFLGGLVVFGAPESKASDLVTMEVALAWMWALPLVGLFCMRAARIGRRLPSAGAFIRMFGTAWRRKLPGVQTQWGEVQPGIGRYQLRVPGANFVLPLEATGPLYAAGGRARVTYDLQRGRIETIEVGV